MLNFLGDFLISRFRRKGRLDTLSNDIIVDHIFTYLSVEDVLSMRVTSKLYYFLSHQPVVWKRLLRHVGVPLPPLPPTRRYVMGATSYEIEQMVIRAYSVDHNLRKHKPKAITSRESDAFSEVLGMTILPGGKYLVASMTDRGHKRYAVMVFVLDHQGKPAVALAKAPTITKAYDLQAKYMTVRGEQGIMIAYLRSELKPEDAAQFGINISELDTTQNLDLPCPILRESVVLHISLGRLELLGEARLSRSSPEFFGQAANLPPPFRQVAIIRSSELSNPSLFECDGMPYLAVVKGISDVVIKDLSSDLDAILHCKNWEHYYDIPHVIHNIRVIPDQKQILVVREVFISDPFEPTQNFFLFELYNMPAWGGIDWKDAKDRYVFDGHWFTTFKISEHMFPTKDDRSLNTTLPKGPSPPISIFCQTESPNGMIHVLIWPTPVYFPTQDGQQERDYYYNLQYISIQSRHDSRHKIVHALPGVFRSLIYTVHEDDRRISPSLISLRRYITPEIQPDGYPVEEGPRDDRNVFKPRRLIPQNIYADVLFPRVIRELLKKNGAAAIAWDESIGRVCVTPEGCSEIYFVDFAQDPLNPWEPLDCL